MEEEAIEIQPKLQHFYTKINIYIRYRRKTKQEKPAPFGLSVSHLEGAAERRRLGRRGAEGGGPGRRRAEADDDDRRERAVVRSDREIEPRKAIVERGIEILQL